MRIIAVLIAAALMAPAGAAQQTRPESAALAAVTAEFMKTRVDGGGAAGASLARVREQAAEARAVLAKLAAIDTAALSHDEWITHALLTFEAERDARRDGGRSARRAACIASTDRNPTSARC